MADQDNLNPIETFLKGNLGDEAGTLEAEQRRRRRQDRLRTLTPAQRRKAKRDDKRKTMAWDLPPEIIETIRNIADEESLSQSNLVAIILAGWINRYLHGEAELDEQQRRPSHHPRWNWEYDIPELIAESEES
jgi:hypothetical protein